MGNPNWRPGILGLVANSLVEAHGKPVFLWGREGGDELRGSCRSDGMVNVVELMAAAQGAAIKNNASDVFGHFGGHHASGGFSVIEERVHELLPRLSAAHAQVAGAASPGAEVLADREMPLSEVPQAHAALKNLAPFGVGFEKPLFIFPRVTIAGVRTFGKTQNHLEVTLSDGFSETKAIAFFAGPDSFDKKVAAGERASVVGHVEADWRGSPRVRVVDIV
jgi:single-stranded-DNA-specific exonuclease